ncbi:MAG: FeoB-associated Cys-rich membrane protein [Desulfobacteraceae bacterium]|nr:FeoB-associated Cys-rich membrane protein [Desulfobacteraceae bacterium]
MDVFVVGMIVAAALFFTIKRFIKNYKGEVGCSSSGCSCSSKESCNQEFLNFNERE